jgi:hypothetical protein
MAFLCSTRGTTSTNQWPNTCPSGHWYEATFVGLCLNASKVVAVPKQQLLKALYLLYWLQWTGLITFRCFHTHQIHLDCPIVLCIPIMGLVVFDYEANVLVLPEVNYGLCNVRAWTPSKRLGFKRSAVSCREYFLRSPKAALAWRFTYTLYSECLCDSIRYASA